MDNTFIPTWLYVKVHNVTGLKYLGKTTQDPYAYLGSGVYWRDHLKKHGNNITTTWAHLYTDPNLLKEEALFFSKVFDIINSAEWANLIVENGSVGGKTYNRTPEHNKFMSCQTSGKLRSNSTKEKIRQAKTGVKRPDGFGNKMSNILSGVSKPADFGNKISKALQGKSKSDVHKLRLSESVKNIPKMQCIHCGIFASPANVKRWHNDNCKSKGQK